MGYDADGRNYPWFKMHSKGWLTGTIRATMTPAERSVWADLLAMANESRIRGVICRAKDIPYTNEYLASYLGVSVDLVTSTIDKCMNDKNMADEQHRIEVDEYGCMHITNWERYQAKPEKQTRQSNKEDIPLSPEDKEASQQAAAARLAYLQPEAATRGIQHKVAEERVKAERKRMTKEKFGDKHNE